MKDKDNQILEIVAKFRWDRVHKTMTALKWEWHDAGVPSIGDMMKHAIDLLNTVADSDGKYSSSSSGGFAASIEDGCLDLSFIVESYCVEGEE